MDLEKIMNGMQEELMRALQDMATAKNLDDRQALSEIVSNISDSMGVFLEAAAAYDDFDDDFYDEDEEI